MFSTFFIWNIAMVATSATGGDNGSLRKKEGSQVLAWMSSAVAIRSSNKFYGYCLGETRTRMTIAYRNTISYILDISGGIFGEELQISTIFILKYAPRESWLLIVHTWPNHERLMRFSSVFLDDHTASIAIALTTAFPSSGECFVI